MQSREEYDRINKVIDELKKEIKERRGALKCAESKADVLENKRKEANAFMPWEETYELEKLEEQLSEENRLKQKMSGIIDPNMRDKEARLLELRVKKGERDQMFSTAEDKQLSDYQQYKRDTEAKERRLAEIESRQKMQDRSDVQQFFDIKGPLDMVPAGMETQIINGEEMHIPCYRPKTSSELIRDKRKCLNELMQKEENGEIAPEVAELLEDKLTSVYDSIRREREDKKVAQDNR